MHILSWSNGVWSAKANGALNKMKCSTSVHINISIKTSGHSVFTHNPKLCLVGHLFEADWPAEKRAWITDFFSQTAHVCGVCSCKVKTTLATMGMDTDHYGPHMTCTTSCSVASNQVASLPSILKQHSLAFTKRQLLTSNFRPSFLHSFVHKHGIWTVLSVDIYEKIVIFLCFKLGVEE